MNLDFLLKYGILLFSALLDFFYNYCFFKIFFNRRPFFQKLYRVIILYLFLLICTFQIHSVGFVWLNILSSVFLIVFDLLIFNVNIGRGILFSIIYIAISIATECFVNAFFLIEWIPATTNYSTILDSPYVLFSTYIIKYIPILICKQSFSKSKMKMKTSTFLMYLMVPVTNILMVSIISIIGITPTDPIIRNLCSLYSFLMIVGSFLTFYSFQRHSMEIEKEQELLENKIKSQSDNELLYLSAKAMRSRLQVVEESMEAERIIRHDRRHFEAMLLELMKQGETEKVQELLEQRVNSEQKPIRKWCDNETINATIEHYVSQAEKESIVVKAGLNVPKELTVDSLQLALTLGNLIENAIHANQQLPEDKRFINLKSVYKKQLLISIENACSENVKLDDNGHPFTKKSGHGIGTKSVIAFAEKNDSEVLYSVENGIFTVQLMIRA